MITMWYSGRLGNLFYEIYSAYTYCLYSNLDFDHIKFVRNLPDNLNELKKIGDYQIESFESLNENFDFFKNIQNKFINGNQWFEQIKDIQILDEINYSNKYQNCLIKYPYVYYDYIPEIVYKIFINKEEYLRLYNKYKYLFSNNNSVALHVRRGDTLNENNYKLYQHGIYNKIWIDRELQQIQLNLKNMTLLVFSDDIAWCKQNIKYPNVFYIENNKPYEDLYLMSMCTKIIRNYSSFNMAAINLYNSRKNYDLSEFKQM